MPEQVLKTLRMQEFSKYHEIICLMEDSPSFRTRLLENPSVRPDWRSLYQLATMAKKRGCLGSVRAICSKILEWEPEYWFARELLRQLDGYYSQADQDRFIENFFNTFGAKHHFFVEVGAFDGVHYSNVRRLYEKYGWGGISIEPVRKNFQKLVDSYAGTKVQCVHAAVSDKEYDAEINVSTYPHLPEWGTDVASLHESEKSRWDAFGAKWTKETVRVSRLEKILENREVAGFDLLSVDAEGSDLAVLKGLNFKRYHPSLVVVEYGENRQPILDFMQSQGYLLLHDNKQDFFFSAIKPAKSIEYVEAKKLVNHHLIDIGFLPKSPMKIAFHDGINFLNSARFDLNAKLLLARYLDGGYESTFARDVYLKHLLVFNGMKELEKKSQNDFINSFNDTLQSIKCDGWALQKGAIPIGANRTIIDGAHRVASAIISGVQIPALFVPKDGPRYDFRWFINRGLELDCADAMAMEYIRWNPNCVIITLFPAAKIDGNQLDRILCRYGDVVYDRSFVVTGDGPELLIWQMYADEPWVGDARSNWPGISNKAKKCFPYDSGNVQAILFEPRIKSELRKLKDEIRTLGNVGNHSVHINDSHHETMLLGSIYFNENSRHFLNHAKMEYFPIFWNLFRKFRAGLNLQDIDNEKICLDGSVSMAAYGLRDCRDIDFLHTGVDEWDFGDPKMIGSHNYCLSDHVTRRDDILFNPNNHFYFHGIKFVSLGILRAMKEKRGEKKDFHDIELIDSVSKNLPAIHLQHNPITIPFNWKDRPDCIVGLVTMRNESAIIAQCLRCLSRLTDAIVVIDDASTDDSVAICEDLREECNVKHIICKKSWHRDESSDRNRLLNAGRSIGGTHFIMLDADECLTHNLIDNNLLRNYLLKLEPGDVIELQWLQLWRSTDKYRDDNSIWSKNYKQFAFRDNWSSFYNGDFLHVSRIPTGLKGKIHRIEGPRYGVMHFQFVQWEKLLIKQAWYRCLERIRLPDKKAAEINRRYAHSKNESDLILKDALPEWFEGYKKFDAAIYKKSENWRKEQIIAWFSQYGEAYFKELDIWDVDWNCDTEIEEIQKQKKKKNLQKNNNSKIALIKELMWAGRLSDATAECYDGLREIYTEHQSSAYNRLNESMSKTEDRIKTFELLQVCLLRRFIATKVDDSRIMDPRNGLSDLSDSWMEKPMTIAYLGASVTAQKQSFVHLLHQNICNFTGQKHNKIVCGKGATGIIHSLENLDNDILSCHPDLCFIEYLSGDLIEGLTQWDDMGPALETVVRNLLKNKCSIIFVHMFRGDYAFEKNNRALQIYEQVANHYGLPSIHLYRLFQNMLLLGVEDYFEIFKDTVHTTPRGSYLAARVVARLFDALIMSPIQKNSNDLPKALFKDKFSDIKFLSAEEASPPPMMGKWKQKKYALLDDSTPLLNWCVNGYLAGISVIVGPDSGAIEISDGVTIRTETLWDHWCHNGNYRLKMIPIGKYYHQPTNISIRFVSMHRLSCGFCYKKDNKGEIHPSHSIHETEFLFQYECPCSNVDMSADNKQSAAIVGLLIGQCSKKYEQEKMRSNLQFWKKMHESDYFGKQMERLNLPEKRGHDLSYIEQFLKLQRKMKVAIIGSGYGRESLLIAPHVKHVYGIDVTWDLLKKSKQFLQENNILNFTPIIADNWKQQLPGDIDLVYSITVFQHITRDLTIDYIRAISKKLSADGKILVQFAELDYGKNDAEMKVYQPDVNWSIPQIRELIQLTGLYEYQIKRQEVPGHGAWHWAYFGVKPIGMRMNLCKVNRNFAINNMPQRQIHSDKYDLGLV